MTIRPTSPTKRRPRVREHSWTTFRKFRCPEKNDRRLISAKLDLVLSDCCDEGMERISDDERIYLPEQVFNALVRKLELVDLPTDRYHAWLAHGRYRYLTVCIGTTLERVGLGDDRAGRIEEGLQAVEPFPSKRLVDRVRIEKVLAEIGDIWPAYRRADHELIG